VAKTPPTLIRKWYLVLIYKRTTLFGKATKELYKPVWMANKQGKTFCMKLRNYQQCSTSLELVAEWK